MRGPARLCWKRRNSDETVALTAAWMVAPSVFGAAAAAEILEYPA